MREGTFREEHEVELSEEDRNLRGRQAARLAVALEKHQVEAKEQKKRLAEREKELEAGILDASRAAEIGTEKRMVECEERLVGAMVITVRLDTGETTGSRAATRQELEGDFREKNEAAKTERKETRDERIRREIVELCQKPRTEALLLKALEKGLPNTTPSERKEAVDAAVEAGAIVEVEGKLVVPSAPPGGAPPNPAHIN